MSRVIPVRTGMALAVSLVIMAKFGIVFLVFANAVTINNGMALFVFQAAGQEWLMLMEYVHARQDSMT